MAEKFLFRYSPGPIQGMQGTRLELRKIAALLNAMLDGYVEVRHGEPEKVKDGMLIYADGTDWDPGSGEGFYGREGGSWVKL